MKNFLLVFLLFWELACTRLQTLNLKDHYYSAKPVNIVWIQVAGFTDQHLPLLRFDNRDANYHTQFESADCLGKMWSFNLYDLRPKAGASFLSQLNGSKNIKGICEDLSRKPVWTYLEEEGYKTSILESGAGSDETLEKFLTCGDLQKSYLKNVNFVRMGPQAKNGIDSFHYQDQQKTTPGLFYDKSCQKGICFSTILNNTKKIMANLNSGGTQNFYLLRDFSYLKAIRAHDFSQAKEVLQDLDKTMAWLDSLKRTDTLVIITGAEGIEVDFPKEGKEWAEYERFGKNLNTRNSALLTSVFAKGPMAENFCGLYDETEMLKRVLFKPEKKKFSWDALNPFSN